MITFVRNLTLFIVLFSSISCNKNHEINQETLRHLNIYKGAKNLIFENIDGINATLAKKEKHLAMRFWNLYYFENSILPENPEFENLKMLWTNNYVSNDITNGLITVGKDGLVGFVTFHEQGFFNSITHLLVFSPKGYKYPRPEEIIEKEEIDSDWTYFVLKKYIAG